MNSGPSDPVSGESSRRFYFAEDGPLSPPLPNLYGETAVSQMCSLGTTVLRKPQGTCGNRRHTGKQEGGGGDPGRHTGDSGGREGCALPVSWSSGGAQVLHLHRCWAGAEGLGMGLGGFTRKLGSFLRVHRELSW